MLGSQEVPPTPVFGRGAVAILVDTDLSIDYSIAMVQPAVLSLTDAHIHVGGAGVPGPVFVDFLLATATRDAATGTAVGSVPPIPLTTLSRIAADLDGFFFNVHTATYPAGAARGQLTDETPEVWSHLRGDRELDVIDALARGGFTMTLDTFTSGRAIFAVPPTQLSGIGSITAAHVHEGFANLGGPVVIDLMAGADFAISPASFSAEGEVSYDRTLYARIVADPERFYANLHTSGAPDGLVRGQLTQVPHVLVAELEGLDEVPPQPAENHGHLTVLLTGVFRLEFTLQMDEPPVGDVIGLHVHDGPAGVNGPILIDLMGGTVEGGGDGAITGSTTFSGRTAARLLGAAPFFYGNAHTVLAPDGAARGQFTLLTEDAPPDNLSYDSPVTYTEGVAIDPNLPTSTGGVVTSYSVDPALPAGLTLNPVSGVISGTPTAPAAAADYTVTASNSVGDTQAVVNITVEQAPPLTLSYDTPVTYVVNSSIAPNSPTSTGGTITSYSVNPAFPTGITLDTTTGVISGTPTVTQGATDHVITGSNDAGSVQATVNVTVTSTLQPPSNLSYNSPTINAQTGYAITDRVPTISGGAVETWQISATLPAGLTFDTSNGHITGTPTALSSSTVYTITASNAAGSTNAQVTVTVTLGAPADLSYSNNPAIGYVQGNYFPTMSPTVGGGGATSYSVNPALPSGVSLNTSTGVITGAPTQSSAFANYTVTASNATGSTQAQISIVIY
jgi:hypothetical protein